MSMRLEAGRNGALMDQKRLFLAIAISVAILLGFQLLVARAPAAAAAASPADVASQTERRQAAA